MTTTTYNNAEQHITQDRIDSGELGSKVSALGDHAIRFTVVLVLAWIGAMKFTAYEAAAIEGLVASSPLISWLYGVLDLQAVSNLIGSVELLIAAALVLAPLHRNIAIAGALAAAGTFGLTFTFLFTAPGWEQSLGGFPALSVVPGQFLLKDGVLFAASISMLGRALSR